MPTAQVSQRPPSLVNRPDPESFRDRPASRARGQRVLVLTPSAPDAALLKTILTQAGLPFHFCENFEDLCRQLNEGSGAVLAAQEALPASAVETLTQSVSHAPAWSDFQLIVLTGDPENSKAGAQEMHDLAQLGSVTFLERPLRPHTLLASVRAALRARQRQYEVRDLLAEKERAMQELNQALEKRVAERTAQLQESHEQMESFTYSISHDLRAPLRAIRGFAQALAEDYATRLDDTGRDYLDRMCAGAERLDQLIQDVLQYSRLGRSTLTFQPILVDRCLAQVLLHLDRDIRSSNAVLEIQHPLPTVLGHGPTLEQVLSNLLSNALKFVAPGTQPHIRIWGECQNNVARLWVQDNGIGISPVHHQRIFGVFERLQNSDAYPGTGIGLAIVAKGVGRMGGKVGVESEPGKGSRFWIELPQPKEPSSEA